VVITTDDIINIYLFGLPDTDDRDFQTKKTTKFKRMGKKPILLHEEKAMKDRFLSHEVAFKKSA
jgi:hypothetical protein